MLLALPGTILFALGKREVIFRRLLRELNERKQAWYAVAEALKNRIPSIIYYPNFLFEFPDKVYLSEVENEKPEQVFYRKLIQDILDTFENDLTIDDHLIKRAASKDYEDKEPLQSVVDRIGSQITSIVLDPNLSILGDSLKCPQMSRQNIWQSEAPFSSIDCDG